MYRRRSNDPWNPGYALPERFYEEEENPIVNETMQRGDIDEIPLLPADHPWNSGYAVPSYIHRDRPGNVQATPQLPDHYVDYLPDDSEYTSVPRGMGEVIQRSPATMVRSALSTVNSLLDNKWLLVGGLAVAAYFIMRKKK